MKVIAQQFIKPSLHSYNNAPIPESLQRLPLWPLRELIIADVQWSDFQAMARRSLIPYANSGLIYEHVDEVKLVDIGFQRGADASRWSTVYDIAETCDLVILDLCRREVPNNFQAACISMLISRCRDLGKPAWVYISTKTKVHKAFGAEVFKLLTPIHTSIEVR